MNPSNVVATVFKVVIISVLLMVIVGCAVNLFIVFDIQSKIDVIGSNMSTELSLNNAILYESRQPFLTQLNSITAIPEGETRGFGRNGVRYTLRDITVKKVTNVSGESVGSAVPLVSGGELVNYEESDDYYSVAQGEYGDFMILTLTYGISYDFFTYTTGGNTIGVNTVEMPVTDMAFEYVVPCLRYNKT